MLFRILMGRCFDKVCSFIDNKRCCNGKILAVYGLRRTGKTFLLNQINEKYKDITEYLVLPLTTYAKYNSETIGYEEIKKYTENDIKQIISKVVADWSGNFDIAKINNKSVYNIVDYPLKKYRRSLGDAARIQARDNSSKINEEYAKQINLECDLSIPVATSVNTIWPFMIRRNIITLDLK